MASLSDLAGTLCAHGLPIEVTPSGNTALCRRPDRSCGGCRTVELKAYAAQLNAARVNGFGASEVLVHSNHDDAGGNRPRRTVSSEKNNATFGGTVSPSASTARQHKSALSESSPLASNEGGDTGVGSAEPKEKPPPANSDGGAGDDSSQNNSHSNGAVQDDVLRRVPPQNIDAEMSVLGSILIENEAIAKIGWLNVEAFYRESHREIYKAMLTLRAGAKPIDLLTLPQALGANLEAAGGKPYIRQLAAFEGSQSNIAHYAGIVRDMSIKRQFATNAMQIVDWAMNGMAVDTIVGQAEKMLRLDTGGGLPNLIGNKIEVMSGLEFHRQQQALPPRSWLVDGLLAKQEISLWSGKVEAGKTTSMRTMVMALMRGEPFLERNTYPSRVFYVMLDADGAGVTYEEFIRLGWNPEDDPLDFLIDPVMAIRPNSFEQFHAELIARKPALVIIDPLGRFQKIDDITDYGTTYAMARFSELAKRCDCHIALLHHIPRGRSDADDPATAGFGSIAVAGGCNARFVFVHKKGDIYTIQSSKGKGGGFRPWDGEQTLLKDTDTGWVTLGGAYSFKDQARGIKDAALEVIQNSDRELTSDALARELHVQRSAAGLAGKMLADEGLVKLRMDGKRYLFSAAQQNDEE